MSDPLDNMTEYARGIVRELAESNTEVRRLRTELAEAQSAHATMLRECQTLITERDTLRQQLAVAREGLDQIATTSTRPITVARDTLAKLDTHSKENS